jgi:Zn-dependent peptidase ImmA (M78 family)
MTLRRGFKTEANDLALLVRAELGLSVSSPLCPFTLAAGLDIPVFTLKALSDADPALERHVIVLADTHRSSFSAITIFDGCRRCIVHNHRHALVRQRSNISHEVAHALLMHPPHPFSCSAGERVYKQSLEEEAGWFGAVLLVANESARWAMSQRMSVADAARHFQVSDELMEFRARMSGAHRIRGRVS